jgi:hypothetical protein
LAALNKAPGLKPVSKGEVGLLLLPESKKEAQDFLREFAGDPSIFNH